MRHFPNRLGALLILTSAGLSSLIAQTVPAAGTRRAIFWKATSPTNSVYLLGSIHLGSKDMYPLAKEIEDAFASSSVLLVEADVRHLDMAKMQSYIFAKGMYSGGDTLWNHVTPETRKKLEEFGRKYEFPVENMGPLRPWVVALSISTIPLLKAGMDPNLGIDMYFLNKAGDKKIVEIESADWQIDLLSGIPEDQQDAFLAAALEEGISMEADIKRMREAWSSGDAEALDRVARQNSKTPEKITRAILQDRNPGMADAAERFLKGKEPAFLVVGAAHLVGKEGVVALLQHRGYKVEQVQLKK